jgi:hypothetical protein
MKVKPFMIVLSGGSHRCGIGWVTAEVKITSLKLNFGWNLLRHDILISVNAFVVLQRIPTNRAGFLSWPNHEVGFALRAFDLVEFHSFDFHGLGRVIFWMEYYPHPMLRRPNHFGSALQSGSSIWKGDYHIEDLIRF